MTRWEAYWAAGFIKPYDFVMLSLFLLTVVTTVFWSLFGNPSATQVLIVLVSLVILLQVWIVSLVFRCSDFVLNAHADIHLLPVEAARIVSAYAGSGSKMPPPAA